MPEPCETETTTSLKMQPETRGSRADAIFSETGARLVGEGGTLNRQAGLRDRLHGARRRSRERKMHCKARGAAAACCCYERGVDIA